MRKPNKVKSALYLEAAQMEALKRIIEKTHIPLSTLFRQGIDLVIAKYQKKLRRK